MDRRLRFQVRPSGGSYVAPWRSAACPSGAMILTKVTFWNLDFAKRFAGFCLGLERLGKGWCPILFFSTSKGWQRVHIEALTCEHCGWNPGFAANHLLPNLYFGVPDELEVLRAAARRFPPLPCPRCGGKLPREAIWTEPSLGEPPTP